MKQTPRMINDKLGIIAITASILMLHAASAAELSAEEKYRAYVVGETLDNLYACVNAWAPKCPAAECIIHVASQYLWLSKVTPYPVGAPILDDISPKQTSRPRKPSKR